MSSKIFEKFFRINSGQQLIREKDHILAGVSGGADSVFMLLMLLELKKILPFELKVFHVNHGLRDNAAEDERFVRELCEKWGIQYLACAVPVRAKALEWGMGTEETGRILRYEAFETACREWDNKETEGSCKYRARVAVAHHMEDQAETVLFRICRGTSTAGLAGMAPQNGRIIRPILAFSRAEIEQELRERGVCWREDESNGEDGYSRNYLRNRIFPLLHDRINAETAAHICELAEDMRETERYLHAQTLVKLQELEQEHFPGGFSVNRQKLLQLPDALRGRILLQLLSQAAGQRKDLERIHIRMLEKLCTEPGNKTLDLPYGITAVSEYGKLYFFKEGDPLSAGEYPCCEEDYLISVRTFDKDSEKIASGPYTKWLDYDKINELPVFRTRQPGDRIGIGGGKFKKLSRLMIDEKIPSGMRERMVLPFCKDQALWVPGHQINEYYKITQTTGRVLVISCRKQTERR